MTRPVRPLDEHGAVAVEMALVLPLLVMLVTGIIQFGLYYNAKLTLTHAAREGVRSEIVGADTNDAIEAAAAEIGIGTDDIDVDIVECEVGVPGDAEVELSAPFKFEIPFADLGATTITSKARMRCP